MTFHVSATIAWNVEVARAEERGTSASRSEQAMLEDSRQQPISIYKTVSGSEQQLVRLMLARVSIKMVLLGFIDDVSRLWLAVLEVS